MSSVPRGFQKFNEIPRVKFFISLGFAEPTIHVIQGMLLYKVIMMSFDQ